MENTAARKRKQVPEGYLIIGIDPHKKRHAGVAITQSYGQQSLVTSFTASGTGYLVINGYSTSSTGYVYTINSTYGNSSAYTFSTTSTTVTIPVQAGSIYIYFGNSDTSGTITAVFSSIYYYHY